MSSRLLPRFIQAVAVAVLCLSAAACEKDPNDASTWIPKLKDSATLDDAVRNLDRLKDPKAIQPLGEAWKRWNKPSKILRAMINIANFDDPTGKKQYIVRKPEYKDAMPYLIEAVKDYDASLQQSIEDGAIAADTLGKSADPAAIEVLVAAATKAMPKTSPANRVRAQAIRALGHFKDPRAVDTLIKILGADPETQEIRLHAAAALALAETGSEKALPALAKAAFVGPIYMQVREGFTRAGKPAVAVAMQIFDGKQPDVVAYAKEKDFAKNAPGAMVYKGALLLGDLHASEALPKLIAGLKQPTQSIGFDPRSGAEQGTSHAGILDALRRIGDPSAADAVYDYMTDEKTDDFLLRPLAMDVYSMISTDTKALPWLLKTIKDEAADPNVRNAAIIAYGRLGKSNDDAAPIKAMIAEYDAKAKKAADKAKAAKSEQDKGAAEQDQQTAESFSGGLKEAQARMDIAIKCKQDAACYAETLDAKDVAVGQPGLPRVERALLEIRKLGPKAQGVYKKLLDAKYLGTSERIEREAILLALPRIAPLPCKDCAEAMDKVLDSQASQTTLDLLNKETKIVYHYFLWAGT
jgi:HEAT repeat protein